MFFPLGEFKANIYIFITHGLAQDSNICTLLKYGLSPQHLFFSITYQYHAYQSLPYTNPIFSPYIVFELKYLGRHQL